jgi:hypothetical protein
MLRLRLRFPDGRSDTLEGIAAETTYADFCERTLADMPRGRPVELLLAGPPARRIELTDQASIGTVLRSGDTLLVSYAAGSAAQSQPQASGLRSGSSRGRGVVTKSARGRVGRVVARGARRKAAAFASAGRGHGLGDADNAPEATDPLSAVGAALVRTVAGGAAASNPADPARRSVQDSLRLAREAREREADGERRYAAFLAGKYEVEYFRLQGGDSALTFRVRYLPPGYRSWREDPPREEDVYSAWSTRLLGAVLKFTLDTNKDQGGGDDDDEREAREGLRPNIMAYQSPRMFWNLVRHFGADMESKMRGLVPDADWTFMNSRKRRLSEKAKRNLENERMFKETPGMDE